MGEDDLAKLGFRSVDAMRIQLSNWGLPEWLIGEESDIQQQRKRVARTARGEAEELPSAKAAAPLLKEALKTLTEYVEFLERDHDSRSSGRHTTEYLQDNRFIQYTREVAHWAVPRGGGVRGPPRAGEAAGGRDHREPGRGRPPEGRDHLPVRATRARAGPSGGGECAWCTGLRGVRQGAREGWHARATAGTPEDVVLRGGRAAGRLRRELTSRGWGMSPSPRPARTRPSRGRRTQRRRGRSEAKSRSRT